MNSTATKNAKFALMGLLATAVALFGLILFLSSTQSAIATQQSETVGGFSVYLPAVISPAGTCYYVETDDAVVIEVESIPPTDEWHQTTTFPDYTGDGYFVWLGPNYLDVNDAGHGLLTYPISLTKSGTYRLNIRNSHPLSPSDFNDVWVRLDDGEWIKGFSNVVDMWTYDFNFEHGGIIPPEFENVEPGLHTLELSARSTSFRIDRLVLSTNGMGQLDTWPESPCVVP